MKKTVLFVYHSLAIGGTEKELLAYITHLDRKDYDVHLALTRIEGELLTMVPEYVQLHEVPGDSITPSVFHLFHLYKTIRKIQPDIVMGFMQDVSFNILFLRYFTNLRYKTIVAEQIVLSQWQILKQTPWLKRLLIAFLYKKADACFAQGESVRKDLENNFEIDPRKLYLIPNFISPARQFSRQEIRTKIRSKNKATYFLYVGRLVPEKNIELLLSAFREVHQINNAVRLYILGPHTNSFYDDLCIKLGIQDAVAFVGYIANPWGYYRRARALVISSSVEGRSRVMIESMIAGCPVITADFVGHDIYIKHHVTGLIFEKKSASDLTRCLMYALKKPKRMQALAIQAKRFITGTYVRTDYRHYTNTLNAALTRILE